MRAYCNEANCRLKTSYILSNFMANSSVKHFHLIVYKRTVGVFIARELYFTLDHFGEYPNAV